MQCAVLSAKLLVITLCHIKLGEPGCQVMQTTCINKHGSEVLVHNAFKRSTAQVWFYLAIQAEYLHGSHLSNKTKAQSVVNPLCDL